MDELEQLRVEKDNLLQQNQLTAETQKLKREIFILKNPIFKFLGNVIKGTFNGMANLGDAIWKWVATPKAKPPVQHVSPAPGSTKTSNTKKRKRGRPKKEVKVEIVQPPKKKGVLESMEETMKNIDREMNKHDMF